MLDLALGKELFIEDKMDEALQELDILFNTNMGEMICNPYYGANWHPYLNVLTPMESSLREYIINLFGQTNYVSQLDYEVNVYHSNDNNHNSTYIVKIVLNDLNKQEGESGKRVQKFYNIR